jgi:hypothetical protein
MVFEPDAQQRPLSWPVVYRGNGSQDWDAQGVSVWAFPEKPAQGLRVLAADYSSTTVKSLGTPGETLTAWDGLMQVRCFHHSSCRQPAVVASVAESWCVTQ